MPLQLLLTNPLIAANVLDYTPAASLHAVSRVSRTMRRLVEAHYAHKLRCLCSRYFTDVDEFLCHLARCKGCITGSAALEVVMNDCEARWQSKDLDVSVPRGYSRRFCEHLIARAGYLQDDDKQAGIPRDQARPGYEHLIKQKRLKSVRTLVHCKRERRIDVLESATESCTGPLCDFHSTAVANALFPDRIVCYFPEYTMVYRTVRNVAHQRARDGRAVSKYVGRGFQPVPFMMVLIEEGILQSNSWSIDVCAGGGRVEGADHEA